MRVEVVLSWCYRVAFTEAPLEASPPFLGWSLTDARIPDNRVHPDDEPPEIRYVPKGRDLSSRLRRKTIKGQDIHYT